MSEYYRFLLTVSGAWVAFVCLVFAIPAYFAVFRHRLTDDEKRAFGKHLPPHLRGT